MRRILLVIDMQNDFIDGALGTSEASAIVENVVKKIQSYKTEDVYATMDTHSESYLITQEGRNLPVPHCIKGTPGWELEKRIAPLILKEHIFEKPAFGSVELAKKMRELAKEDELEIELVGLCTDICVVSNALLLKAALPETKLLADAACCAGVTPQSHDAALSVMKSCQVEII